MNIIKSLINKIKNFDKKTKKIMNTGFLFSFILCIIACITLLTYDLLYNHPSLFYIGISLLRTSLMFASTFFICAIGFDSIKKEFI